DDAARDEEVVARLEVDPLVAGEHRDLALENVERLVLVVVDVDRRRTSPRLVHHELGERVAGLLGAGLARDTAALPPGVREAVARGEAVELSGGFRGHGAPSRSGIGYPVTVGAPTAPVS